MKKPKIIHYCWFGPVPFPQLTLRCIESWKKYFPDYEFKFWHEENSEIEKSIFASQALKVKQYAFVSDYVRVQALYQFGGTYFDTDLEALPGLKECLESHENIIGFEGKHHLGTALMSFMPQHNLMHRFLRKYDHPFIVDGVMDINANPQILQALLLEDGLIINNRRQTVKDIEFFPRHIFFPKQDGNHFIMTPETLSIHHFEGSWLTNRQKKRGKNKIWINVCRPCLRGISRLLTIILGGPRVKQIELTIRKNLR